MQQGKNERKIANSAHFGATGKGDKLFYGTIESRSCQRCELFVDVLNK
jgi:hypothetical protein